MKILIISHNPMSTQFGIGKTLLSLFSEFKKEELCQLYTNSALPNQDVCESYYRITDQAVLKGVFQRKVIAGTVIAQKKTDGVISKKPSNPKNRQPHREILRDIIWKLSPWYSSNLKSWLLKQRPTCIFVAIGSGKFLYELSLKISNEFHIPIVTYVCDDFYFMEPQPSICSNMWKKMLVKKTDQLLATSKGIVAICEELGSRYGDYFNKDYCTIMTGTNYSISQSVCVKRKISKLSYFGRLNINRFRSLAEIAQTLDLINCEKNTNIILEIYSEEPSETVKKSFEAVRSVKFCGFLNGKDFSEKFFNAHILVHVEAFDRQSIERVRFSVSTKIADSLASGIPLFAYGPEEVASIQHLVRNQCAIVSSAKETLKENLEKILFDEQIRNAVATRELQTAQLYHNPKVVSPKLYEFLEQSQKNR